MRKIDSYLWDRSGEADPEVVGLEDSLGLLRQRGSVPALPPRIAGPGTDLRERRVTFVLVPALVLAAALVLVVAWFDYGQRRVGWAVERLSGSPVLEGRVLDGASRLGVGGLLETDGGSRARVAVGQIGEVDVDPGSRLRLVESRAREHRIALDRGTIHARIWAPPRFFYVNTPSAVAIDLGCAYTLQVDETGAGLVRVTHGWVGFERDGRKSLIPEQAVCATRPGIGPGTPRYEDAPEGFPEALALLDFGVPDDPARVGALALVLDGARPRDALTLWHLLTRGSPGERARVFDRLAMLKPPPAGVTRDRVLGGDSRALDRWWDSLGLASTTWWRLWIRNW